MDISIPVINYLLDVTKFRERSDKYTQNEASECIYLLPSYVTRDLPINSEPFTDPVNATTQTFIFGPISLVRVLHFTMKQYENLLNEFAKQSTDQPSACAKILAEIYETMEQRWSEVQERVCDVHCSLAVVFD